MQFAKSGQDLGDALNHPLFEGTAFLRGLVDRGALSVNDVLFEAGGRTKWHVHDFEQILIVTEGAGIVATDDEEREVVPGDVILITPGERHWHGGRPDSAMRHISINSPGETTW